MTILTKLRKQWGTFGAAISTLMIFSATPLVGFAQEPAPITIDLPAQPLQQALAAIGNKYGVTVIAPGDLVRGKTAPPIAGGYTADEAVAQLLQGSDLESGRSSSGSIVIAQSAQAGAEEQRPGSQAAREPRAIDTIVVTASRTGSPIEDLPVSVSVIDEEALAKQLAFSTNIMRSLEFAIPGLSPQQDGRSNCTPNIRGRATSIQINGVPVNEELRDSTCNQMYQLSPFAIERIEVLRGGTALYGAGSPGGIINFITRRAAGEKLEIDAVAQTSFNTSKADETFATDLYAGAGQTLGDWDYYAGVAYSDGGVGRNANGGFTPGREFSSVALNGSVGGDFAGGDVRLTATWYREKPGQEYDVPFPVFETDANGHTIVRAIDEHPLIGEAVLRSTTAALSYFHPEVLGHEINLNGYYQDQFYDQRDNLYGCCLAITDSEHSRLGFRSTLVKRADLGAVAFTGSYGFDFTHNRYYRPDYDSNDVNKIIEFTSPEVSLDTYAMFGQAEFDFGRLRVTGGVRQEWYRGEVGKTGYSGNENVDGASVPGDFGDSNLRLFNLGAVVDVTNEVQLYGGFSQGAELSELGRAARNITNPGLITPEPATSDQYELGLRGALDALSFEVSGFYSTSDKAALLQVDPACTAAFGCYLVPLRVAQRFWGMEASADWQATERLDVSAVITWQNGKIFDKDLGRFVRYSADVVAPLRITGGANYLVIDGLNVSVQGTWSGGSDVLTPGGQVDTEGVFLADASVQYRVGPGDVYVAAANLLNNEYVNLQRQTFGNSPGNYWNTLTEGRRVTFGYRARF